MLLEHVMQVLEHVLKSLISSQSDLTTCSLFLCLGAVLQM